MMSSPVSSPAGSAASRSALERTITRRLSKTLPASSCSPATALAATALSTARPLSRPPESASPLIHCAARGESPGRHLDASHTRDLSHLRCPHRAPCRQLPAVLGRLIGRLAARGSRRRSGDDPFCRGWRVRCDDRAGGRACLQNPDVLLRPGRVGDEGGYGRTEGWPGRHRQQGRGKRPG